MHALMSRLRTRNRLLPKSCLLTVIVSTLVIGGPAGIGSTSVLDPVLRVEEDWQLVLNEPDSLARAPQFHTVMSPFGNLDSYYALVSWNYREVPTFEAGGLQIQDWRGESQLGAEAVGDQLLSTTAETITWTQRLRMSGTAVIFEIVNGHSTTWGNFGEGMQICQYAGISQLGNYSTNVSAENSWITYGANRVDKMVITSVRRYHLSGLVTVDSTPRVVYEHQDVGIPDIAPDPSEDN